MEAVRQLLVMHQLILQKQQILELLILMKQIC